VTQRLLKAAEYFYAEKLNNALQYGLVKELYNYIKEKLMKKS
jgi:hypothetical protein